MVPAKESKLGAGVPIVFALFLGLFSVSTDALHDEVEDDKTPPESGSQPKRGFGDIASLAQHISTRPAVSTLRVSLSLSYLMTSGI